MTRRIDAEHDDNTKASAAREARARRQPSPTAAQWFANKSAGDAHKERDQRQRARRSYEAAHSNASHCTAAFRQQVSWRRSQRARSATARTPKLRGRTQQRLALHRSGSPADSWRRPQRVRPATARTPKLRGRTQRRLALHRSGSPTSQLAALKKERDQRRRARRSSEAAQNNASH